MWTVLSFVQDSLELTRKEVRHQPFDPQSSQLFSITFKLLFTKSRRTDLKVLFPPPSLSCFVCLWNAFQYYLFVSQATVRSIPVCQCEYVWSFCFWSKLFYLVSLNPTTFCHPMERHSFLEKYWCICYKRLRRTMPSSQTGGNRVGLMGETKVGSVCWLFNCMYIFKVLFMCVKMYTPP